MKFREFRLCFGFAFSRLDKKWKWFLTADDGETPAKKHKKEKKKKKEKEATKQPDEHDEEEMETSATVVRTPTCPVVLVDSPNFWCISVFSIPALYTLRYHFQLDHNVPCLSLPTPLPQKN